MNVVGKPKRVTQNRVVTLLRDKLYYCYLGTWTDRLDNSNIKENLRTDCLTKCKYSREGVRPNRP